MEPSRSRWHIFLQIIQALATAGAIAKIVIDSLGGDLEWLYFVLFAVIGIAQGLFFYLTRPRDRVSLVKGSRKFADYFVDWYKREGEHFIFCNDMDWLRGGEEARIVQAIADRGRKMTICTRDTVDEIVDRLRRAGVSVHQVPAQSITHAAMSLHKVDGTSTLIIRHKHGTTRNNKIHFIETRNKVVVALAQDLFQSMVSPHPPPPAATP
jgi:hypothetical protein